MPMMLVVDVQVVVPHRLVAAFVFVSLRQVQPDADAHERGRDPEEEGQPFLEHRQG